MTPAPRRRRTPPPALTVLLLIILAMPAVGAAPAHADATTDGSAPAPRWAWPVAAPRRVVAPFLRPAHDYGPGHRGIDLAADGAVLAPDDGVVAFVGRVVDRPLITIAHADGLVSTLEPVRSDLTTGTTVRRGEVVGVLDVGGHAPDGTLHLGARSDGEYLDPLILLGGVRRAVLLPCC